jgi:hypothetical protein
LRAARPILSRWLEGLLSNSARYGGFRRMRRGAIVSLVRVSSAMRARFLVTILSLALVYAFACSATCAICLGAGAGAAAETQSHACEHAAPAAAGRAQQRGPAKPDCFGHHHSGFEFVQSDGLSRFDLSATGSAGELVDGALNTEAVTSASSFLSDLALPRQAAIFPQRKISILRI